MDTQLQKDESIVYLIEQLRVRLGGDLFDIVDHWDGDLRAIGIARPDNHSVLVYISTSGGTDEHYSVSLELPPQPNSDFPYTAIGDYEVTSIDALAELVREHLREDGLN